MNNKKHISQESLERDLEPLYSELKSTFQKAANKSDSLNYDDLVFFTTQLGSEFPADKNQGIIFYGRFNNGWNEYEHHDLETILSEQTWRPFYNLMKQVSQPLYGESWYKRIAWSNVFKAGPDGGNPTWEQMLIQDASVGKIFQTEIEYLSPAAIVLVTGNTAVNWNLWHAPAYKSSKIKWKKIADYQWGEDSRTGKPCTASLFRRDNLNIILTDRPEFRSVSDHATCIVSILKGCGITW